MKLITNKIKNHFQIIGKTIKNNKPPTTTTGENEDLYITGMVSNTNKDLQEETITKEALSSMQKQLKGLNLHIDHDESFNGAIGTITDSLIKRQ